ncbi:MAG: GNVR domain-containing protein [bacterium]|nr:GNVR domain-containing protein [bacterium]
MDQITFTIRDYLMIFFRRKWIFILALSLCLIGGIIYVLSAPKVYNSASIIYIQKAEILNPLMDKVAVSSQYNETIKTMTERILSWPRLVSMTESIKLSYNIKTPLDFEKYIIALRKRINIEMFNQDLVRISFEDKDPYIAKQVVDYLTNNFIDETIQLKSEEAVKAIDFIREQLDVYRKRLETSEKDLSEIKVKAEIENIDKIKGLIKDQLSRQEKVVVSEVKKEQNPVVKQLNDHVINLEKELSRLLIDSTEQHPRVQELRKEITKTKEKLAQEMEKSKSVSVEEKSATNPIYADLDQRLKALELKREELLQKQAEIKSKSGKYKLSNVSDAELSAMDRDAQVNEQLYTSLLSKMESARISQQMENMDKGTRFKVIDPARMPLKPSKPDIFKSILMSIALGLGLGLAGIYLLEYLDHSLRNIEDAKAFFTKPILGAISKISLEEDATKNVNRIIRS